MTEQVEEEIVDTVVETKIDPEEYANLKAEVDRLKQHAAKVVEEKHAKEQKAKEAIAKAELDKAEKEGDMHKLLEMKENEYKQMLQERDTKLSQYEQEKKDNMLNSVASKLASELSNTNAKKAETLASILKSRLQLTEDGVKVTDGKGNLLSDNLDVLKEFAKKEYDFLCDGLQSTGGAGVAVTKPTGTENQKLSALDRLMRANSE